MASKNPRHPARVPSVFRGSSRLAPVPPVASVLPPGAGNEEPKKALKADDEGAQESEGRAVRQAGVVQGHLDTPAVRPNGDGNMASIATIEQTQHGLQNVPGSPGRSAQSTSRSVIAQPPELHRHGTGALQWPDGRLRIGPGIHETAGRPTVSSVPCGADGRRSVHFQR